ncbi:MAG: DUF2796 domain-containing protein [Lautropia sp.]
MQRSRDLAAAALRTATALAASAVMTSAVAQHQHTHTHGHIDLDAAIDSNSITIRFESPLDNLLGFERAPRTDAERARVADLRRRLEAADQLFRPDPAGRCKLADVQMESAVLGFGDTTASRSGGSPPAASGAAASGATAPSAAEHADIDVAVKFDCEAATAARYIDIGLFTAFKRIRTIAAQIASPAGQFQRKSSAKAPRLVLGP